MADFDIEGARKEGYSDAEIAGYLAKQKRFDYTGARREGYSDTEILSHLTGKKGLAPMNVDPTEGMSTGQKFLAGAGSSLAKIGRGVGQRLGLVSEEDVAEARKLDRPLMESGSEKLPPIVSGKLGVHGGQQERSVSGPGAAGAVAGEILPLAAVSTFLPEANTILGSTALGAARGAVEPTTKGESVAKNVATGAAAGGVPVAALKGAAAATRIMKGRATLKGAEEAASNKVRDADIKEAKDAGYKLTPTQLGQGAVARASEGLAGSAKMEKLASVKNQKVTNRLVKNDLSDSMKDLGLKPLPNTPVTVKTLEDIRSDAAQYYNEVDKIPSVNWDPKFDRSVKLLSMKSTGGAVSHPAEKAIDDLIGQLTSHPQWDGKSLRSDVTRLRELSKTNYSAAERAGGDAEKTALARAQDHASDLLEQLAERNLHQNKLPADTISNFRKARQLMAKTYTVENALNETTGDVSAKFLGRELKRGKPLTGGMKKAARFARAFEGSARDPAAIRDPSEFGYGDLLLGGLGGAATHVATGNVAGLAALAARPTARHFMLSEAAQRQPSYGPGMRLRLADATANSQTLRRLAPAAAIGLTSDLNQ